MTEIIIALIGGFVMVTAHFRTLANYSAGRSAKKSTVVFCGGMFMLAVASVLSLI